MPTVFLFAAEGTGDRMRRNRSTLTHDLAVVMLPPQFIKSDRAALGTRDHVRPDAISLQ